MHRNIFYFVTCLVFLSSCTDVFEKNMEKQTVILLAPANNLQTDISTHTFWWEEVKHARYYNLQLVKGSFSNILSLELDTHLTSEKFTYTLLPGSYQWRVRAYNNGSSTAFSVFSLQIDSTSDLSQQQVVLIAPANQFVSNNTQPIFQWYELYNAESYRFEIRTPNWNGVLAISPQIISAASYTPSIPLPEGLYEWGVQALNNASASAFSKRSIHIDTTAPGKPTLIAPINNAQLPDAPFTFSWNRAADSGSTLHDSLYIFADTNLTNLVKSVGILFTSHSDSLGQGNYFWRVITYDAAGNKGIPSDTRKTTIQ
jgi:hypothetical protein